MQVVHVKIVKKPKESISSTCAVHPNFHPDIQLSLDPDLYFSCFSCEGEGDFAVGGEGLRGDMSSVYAFHGASEDSTCFETSWYRLAFRFRQ